MKANEVMKKYDISRTTLWRWVKEGKINYTVKPSGHYDYFDYRQKCDDTRKNVVYGRVSSTTQKDNLPRQIDRVKNFASSKGIVVHEVYSEVASALNYNRKQYRKLYKEVIERKIGTVMIEYRDRLLRIGFDDFEELCKLHGTTILVADETVDASKSKAQEITDDLISIIHHFSSKIYSSRRIKKIKDCLSDAD